MTKDMFRFIPTDILPLVGGASGSIVAIEDHPFSATWYGFLIMTFSGAVIGYFVKLLLDYLIKKKRK